MSGPVLDAGGGQKYFTGDIEIPTDRGVQRFRVTPQDKITDSESLKALIFEKIKANACRGKIIDTKVNIKISDEELTPSRFSFIQKN